MLIAVNGGKLYADVFGKPRREINSDDRLQTV